MTFAVMIKTNLIVSLINIDLPHLYTPKICYGYRSLMVVVFAKNAVQKNSLGFLYK